MRCLGIIINTNSLKSLERRVLTKKRTKNSASREKHKSRKKKSPKRVVLQRNSRILGISPLAHVDVINWLSSSAARKNRRSSSTNPRFSRANCSISEIFPPPDAIQIRTQIAAKFIYFSQIAFVETKWQFYCFCLIIPHIFTAFFARVQTSRENVEEKLLFMWKCG